MRRVTNRTGFAMAELLHIFVAGRRACFLLFRPRLSCSKPFPVSRGLPLAILRLLLFVALLCGGTLPPRPAADGSTPEDRTSAVWGKSVYVRVELGGGSPIKKKKI